MDDIAVVKLFGFGQIKDKLQKKKFPFPSIIKWLPPY